MTLSIGIDIGGTFTDVAVLTDEGDRHFGKALTTYGDPSQGVFAGLTIALERAGRSLSDAGLIVHGTTLVTNALIERKGAITALITTDGFRDSIEIGTESRFDLFDLTIDKPTPLVPRPLRFGVRERMLVTGEVLTPLDEEDVRRAVRSAVKAGATAIGVCLLHAYANPAHELRVRDIISEEAPGMRVSLSSEVAPEIREYPRACTTLANVYMQQTVESYLARLTDTLAEGGFQRDLQIMLSGAGIATPELAARLPIGLLESGPVGGVVAAAHLSRTQDLGDLVVFDMGGTTAKFSLLEDGDPTIVQEMEVARTDRFKKGSGIPIKVPVVDMIEIGAGGGSIARVDGIGRLQVGPDSAGSEPGPVCYGRGGTQPTVTDANLALGYLDPDNFLGGTMSIDRHAAREAIDRSIARPLGMKVEEAAHGILKIVTETMGSAARVHAAERGRDLRAYSMIAFGGAGPLHAHQLARTLGTKRLIVPAGAGVLSAFGFLTVPLSYQFSTTLRGTLDDLDLAEVTAALAGLEAQGRAVLARSGHEGADVTVRRFCEMRYLGQSHDVTIDLGDGAVTAADMRAAFRARYRELYRYVQEAGADLPVEALVWRVRVSGPMPDRQERPASVSGRASPVKAERPIWVPARAAMETAPVYDRYALAPGFEARGPLVVEEAESTLIVADTSTLSVDTHLNLIVTQEDAA